MRRIAYPYRVIPDDYVDVDTSRQGLTESRSQCVCLVCSPLCLQYQVGESCAYVNASRTPRDTRNFHAGPPDKGRKTPGNCARRT